MTSAITEGDAYDLRAIDSELDGSVFAGKLHYFAEIDSTSSRAMREAANGAPHGSVYLADAQTGGRGRGAHTWASPPATGIYVSVLLRPLLSPQDSLWLSLAAGLAARAAVLEVTGLAADLRWPNDLLFGPRKFAGILTEMHAEVTRVRHVVIGIGINVGQRAFAAELSESATSIAIESGREFARGQVLVALLRALERELQVLSRGPAAHQDILMRLEAQSTWIRGRSVHVEEDGGYSGVTAGLDAQGFLHVDTAAGRRTVRSGGVRPADARPTGVRSEGD